MGPTWNDLDIGGRVHRHHLGVDADAVSPEWVEAFRNLHQRHGRMAFWVKVVLDGLGARVDIEVIRPLHHAMTPEVMRPVPLARGIYAGGGGGVDEMVWRTGGLQRRMAGHWT